MSRALVFLVLSFSLCGSVSAQTSAKTVGALYPGLSSGALASAEVSALPAGTIFRSGEMVLTQKDLDAEIRKSPQNIWPQLKRNLFFVLEKRATSDLLVAEARAWAEESKRDFGMSETSLVRSYLETISSKASISEDEMKAFYEENKSMMGDTAFDQIKSQIREFLLEQKRKDMVTAHLNTIGTRFNIQIDEKWLSKQYEAAMDNPVDRARKSGRPTFVDFGADGCRPCDMMKPFLDAIKKEYEGKVNVVFVHVREEQVLAARYGVESIPVQIFYDKDGSEVFRHVGFFSKDQIVAKLTEMGVR